MAVLGLSKNQSKSKTQSQSQSASQSGQETLSRTGLDPRLEAALYGNLDRIQGLAASSQPYSGQRVAGFTPEQLQGQQALRSIYDGQVGGEALDRAVGMAGGGQRLADMDVSAYIDPYVGNVVNTTLADLDRARRMENLQNDARAVQAGAYGGTGAEVARSLTNDNFARAAASSAGALRSQAYQNALTAGAGDLSRTLQAAGLLGQLSDQQLAQASTRANLLNSVGDVRQALAQRGLDAAYDGWRYDQDRQIALQTLLNGGVGLIPQYGFQYGNQAGWQYGTNQGSETTKSTSTQANASGDFKLPGFIN